MSPTDPSVPVPSAPDPESRRAPAWKRGGLGVRLLGVLLLGALAFVLIRGGEQPPPETPAPPPDDLIHIPLPPTPHKDVLEQARGIYMLESEQATFSLELLSEGRFRFSSRMQGQKQRRATGTWNLVGTRLTMVYRRVDDAPVEKASVANNVHRGKTIELRETGLDFPVVLTKRTMIRGR